MNRRWTEEAMKLITHKTCAAAVCAVLAIGGFGLTAAKADDGDGITKDHRIGYVVAALHWSVYQTPDGKAECPNGLSPWGPRETFQALYPKLGPVVTTEEAREALKYFPWDQPPKFPYVEAQGNTAIGLNLDGKVGPHDYVSPEGEKGIDNAFYKVIGCNAQFRAPTGQLQLFANKQIPEFGFDRAMIEITGVHSLTNDDKVDVTTYRGRDALVLDASGDNVAPGGSQRIDMRYGKSLIRTMHGKIENGVLTTEPIAEAELPWAIFNPVPAVLKVRDARLRMKLTPTSADGLLAGYYDVDSLYRWLISWSTHHLSYGQLDPSEFYWELRKNADAYPDKDGHMTAISAAITINMAQVYVVHPDGPAANQVASRGGAAEIAARQ